LTAIRSFDPLPFNIIANDSATRPWLGGVGLLDLSPAVRDIRNFCFLTEGKHGAYIYTRLADGLYAAHTLASPPARGRPMLTLMRESLRFLFMATDATEIVTTVPDSNSHASKWADLAGFTEAHRREACFDLNGQIVGASFRRLTYADWVLSDPSNRKAGERFHTFLAEHGVDVDHPDDPVHDAWAGATYEAVTEGNLLKGVDAYNRYAALAGYRPVLIASLQPTLLDLGNCAIQIASGRLEIVLVPTARSADLEPPRSAACPQESSRLSVA
jgi:hypothetical protein